MLFICVRICHHMSVLVQYVQYMPVYIYIHTVYMNVCAYQPILHMYSTMHVKICLCYLYMYLLYIYMCLKYMCLCQLGFQPGWKTSNTTRRTKLVSRITMNDPLLCACHSWQFTTTKPRPVCPAQQLMFIQVLPS